jgi:hypothetical protein
VELANAYASDRRTTIEDPPHVPSRVRRVLERGLSLDPDDRFPSMQALLDVLDRPRRAYGRWAAAAAALVGTAMASATIAIWLTRQDAAAPICEDTAASAAVSTASVADP